MNIPTLIIGTVVAIIFIAIVARGIHNHKHHKGGCSCGCGSCPNSGLCHPTGKN